MAMPPLKVLAWERVTKPPLTVSVVVPASALGTVSTNEPLVMLMSFAMIAEACWRLTAAPPMVMAVSPSEPVMFTVPPLKAVAPV